MRFQKASPERIITDLLNALGELVEDCDHSVGICWCETLDLMVEAMEHADSEALRLPMVVLKRDALYREARREWEADDAADQALALHEDRKRGTL